MVKKEVKALINKAGSGSYTVRVPIPNAWGEFLGVDKDNRDLEIELTENKEIIIRKKGE